MGDRGLVETFGGVMSEELITKRTIMTENFEATDAAMDGGYPYTDRYGNSMKSLEGMHVGSLEMVSVKAG